MKHKERVKQIESIAKNNKVFIVALLIAAFFLVFGNFIFDKKNQTGELSQKEAVTGMPQSDPADETQLDEKRFRFYFIDLWILGIGAGLCLIMIIRERKKAKEELK